MSMKIQRQGGNAGYIRHFWMKEKREGPGCYISEVRMGDVQVVEEGKDNAC